MRITEKCCGDCSQCQLLTDGRVDMIPCILDQLFQRVKRMDEKLNNNKETHIADVPEE